MELNKIHNENCLDTIKLFEQIDKKYNQLYVFFILSKYHAQFLLNNNSTHN